jgi:hypothetical protein
MSKSKKLFKDVDPEEARKIVKDYFLNEFLPDDAARGEDEEAAREHMFDKLSELESVVRDLKKGLKKHG